MKTTIHISVLSLLAAGLIASNTFAQTTATSTYFDDKLIRKSSKAMKQLTKRSDNAIRARFFNEINSILDRKIQTIMDNTFTSTNLKGKIKIIISVSPEKKIEILHLYGNNQTLISLLKEHLKKESIVIPRAMEGKYMIPVVF